MMRTVLPRSATLALTLIRYLTSTTVAFMVGALGRLTRCGSPRSWLTSAALACRWRPSTSGALALVERNSQDLWIGVLCGLLVIS